MAKAAELKVNIMDATAGCVIGTVRITGMRRFNLRVRLASALIHLAGWVAPAELEVKNDWATEDDRD